MWDPEASVVAELVGAELVGDGALVVVVVAFEVWFGENNRERPEVENPSAGCFKVALPVALSSGQHGFSKEGVR